MIVKEHSPISCIPRELSQRDILLLEGLRYSANMTLVAYGRLRAQLHQISLSHTNNEVFYSALIDAWSVIDSAHRFYKILIQLPIDDPESVPLKANWEQFKKVRDTFHHLDERINEKLIHDHYPIFGVLSWVYLDPAVDPKKGKIFTFAPGILQGEKTYDQANPTGQRFRAPIDHISLTSVERAKQSQPIKVSFVPIIQDIEATVRLVEDSLNTLYDKMKNRNDTFQSDACVALLFEFKDPVA